MQKSVIYFYTPEIKNVPTDTLEVFNSRCYSSGLHHWVHFTYAYFKYINDKHHYDIFITQDVPEEGIIVFHRGFFPSNLKPTMKQLFVCLQVDYGKHRYAQVQIIHNPKAVYNSIKSRLDNFFSFTREIFIPSWPQVGLIGRSKTRAPKIENVRFIGHAKNLPKELRSGEWTKRLKEGKINFQIISDPEKWSDFSQADLILAMRSFDKRPHFNKPFLKITNAIFAGVPVVATSESSHLYLKYDKKVDFSLADDVDQLVSVIDRISANPLMEFHKAEINKQRLGDYTYDAVFQSYFRLFKDCDVALKSWSKATKIERFLYFRFRQIRLPKWLPQS